MDKLNLGQHISQRFNEELEEVRNMVLQMGGIVEEQLAQAVRALTEGDHELAHEVVLNDYKVNALEVEIDEESARIVARRQPAASDLRLVMAVIKTITDLERMGDEAKRVGKMVEAELDGTLRQELRLEIEHMGVLVRDMLRMVLDAFARMDAEAAAQVFRADDRVDAKYISITRQLMTYMAEDPKSIPKMLNVCWAARAMERMGDRCLNIAEYVIYLVHGKNIRHTSRDAVIAELSLERDGNEEKMEV